MRILEAAVSGAIQGITEFLPISSSGHIVLLNKLFGYSEPKVLENVLLHFGTLVAIIIFFRKDIIALLKDKKLLFLIIVGSVPVAIVGFFFGEKIEPFFADTKIVGGALLITGLWLLLGSLVSRRTTRQAQDISLWHALLIGIAQAVALIPGISRSGATISTALLLKRERNIAFRFSFLISIPAVIGALFYKMRDFAKVDLAGIGIMMGASFIACVVGTLALWVLKNILLKEKLHYFSIYCFVIGLVILFNK